MNKPFNLEFLETINKRYALPEESKTNLWIYQTGFEGQVAFDRLLQGLFPSDWILLNDLTLEHKSRFIQIDSLLISPHAIYHFEVKNLKSKCDYRDGDFYKANSNYKYKNYFEQMDRQRKLLKAILEELDVRTPLVSKLVLINEEDTVNFIEDVPDLYLKHQDIKPFIWEQAIIQANIERKLANPKSGLEVVKKLIESKIEPTKVEEQLNAIKVSEYLQESYPESVFVQDVRKGILCQNCNTSIHEVERYRVRCGHCGHLESKEHAVVRTICEIGLMNYDQPITFRMVKDFLEGCIPERTYQRYLKKYFANNNTNNIRHFNNPRASINKAFPKFET